MAHTDLRRNQAGSMSPVVPILVALIAIAVFMGWYYLKKQNATVPPKPPEQARHVVLRIHGSNTIGGKLMPALVQAYFQSINATGIERKPVEADEVDIQGVLPGEKQPSVVELQAHGTGTGMADLLAGKCDIAMASRRIDAKESAAAMPTLGDLTAHASEHVIGLDGVAVIVNQNNPVQILSKDQLAKIFSGAITDWSAVNGNSGSIKVFARDEKSGTWDTFKSLVLKTAPLAPGAVRVEDSTELSTSVAHDQHAIGFIGMPYILSAKAVAISESETRDGQTTTTRPLYPNRLTVATEDYPLTRRLYLYAPSKTPNQWMDDFVKFAISKQGQNIVGDNGFVSQNPEAVPVPAPAPTDPAVPERYRQLTDGRKRITSNFFFVSGKAALDGKAMDDIRRIVDLLVDLKYPGDSVVLLGFADNLGSEAVNLRLSKERAEAVSQQFRMQGIDPATVEGLGSANPIASNDTPAGREKNRRVEIWVKR